MKHMYIQRKIWIASNVQMDWTTVAYPYALRTTHTHQPKALLLLERQNFPTTLSYVWLGLQSAVRTPGKHLEELASILNKYLLSSLRTEHTSGDVKGACMFIIPIGE